MLGGQVHRRTRWLEAIVSSFASSRLGHRGSQENVSSAEDNCPNDISSVLLLMSHAMSYILPNCISACSAAYVIGLLGNPPSPKELAASIYA